MAGNEWLIRLKNELAELYDGMETIREVLRDAGIPLQAVSLQGRASAIWSEVLAETERQGQTLALVRVALKNYPKRPVLNEVEQELIEREETAKAEEAGSFAGVGAKAASAEERVGLRVFVSHSPVDKREAQQLYRRLQGENWIRPWLDDEDLLAGQDWRMETMKAVRNSQVVLVCLTSEALGKAGNVQREIRLALDEAEEQPEGAIFIIPVMFKECELPFRLEGLGPVRMFEGDGYARLLRALRARAAELGAAVEVEEGRRGAEQVALVEEVRQEWPPNPFTDVLWVSRKRFVGRAASLQRLRNVLSTGSLHLRGEVKIGKSSLLRLLYQEQCDLKQRAVFGDLEYQTIEEIVEEIGEVVGVPPNANWSSLRRALIAQPFYLFLDEFDYAPQMGITTEWGRRLRGLAGGGFRLVTAARREPKEILPHTEPGSDWYNFLAPETLEVLSQVEAEKILTSRLSVDLSAQIFSPEVQKQLLSMSQRHPFKLMRAAFRYYDYKTIEPDSDWQRLYYSDLRHFGVEKENG